MAAILAILVSIKEWAAAIAAVFGFARQVADTVQTESDKSSGRSEANADTLRQEAERVRLANEAEIEAERDHGARPSDDSAFDQDFKRKD